MTSVTLPAHALLAAGSKSFALAGRLLPAACRDDAAVLYAFCRRADDAIDLVPPAAQPEAVRRLRAELDAVFQGRPQSHPTLAAFQELARRRRIPRLYADELVAGFAMDAAGHRYRSWADLRLYCYRVAGVVGLMMCHVMGISDERRLANAAALGMAMQLTNINRDVAEDWAHGRLYIPEEVCGLAGPHGPLDPGLARSLPALEREARRLYRLGQSGLGALSFRAALCVRAAALIYGDIGRIVASRGYDVTAPRAVVSLHRKLWLLVRAAAHEGARRLFRPGRSSRLPSRVLGGPDDVR
jgi:phytoene synthase